MTILLSRRYIFIFNQSYFYLQEQTAPIVVANLNDSQGRKNNFYLRFNFFLICPVIILEIFCPSVELESEKKNFFLAVPSIQGLYKPSIIKTIGKLSFYFILNNIRMRLCRVEPATTSTVAQWANPHVRFRRTEDWDHRLHHPRHEGRLQLRRYDLSGRDRGRHQGTNIQPWMKKIVHVVFKYLPRSLLLKGVAADGVMPPPLNTTRFPSWFVDISFKDDITVVLLPGVPFVRAAMDERLVI